MTALQNSIALVTGASSGLGRHFATVLARAGATMALAARRVEPLEELARSIEATGVRALAVHMDVTSSESVRTAFDRLVATEAARRLRTQRRGGAIVNIASILGFRQQTGAVITVDGGHLASTL